MRKVQFQNEYIYHIYNRGVDKRKIFSDNRDYLRFLKGIREFNTPKQIESLRRHDQIKRQSAPKALSGLGPDSPLGASDITLVEIICFALLPNHFHLLLMQKVDGGISKFMQKLGQGYTGYFNLKNKRTGSLLAGTFKSVEIKSDSQLLYVSSYINANSEIHKISKAEKWIWSSYLDYLGKRQGTLGNKKIILKEFKNINNYNNFTAEVINSSREIKEELKKMQIEDSTISA